MPHVEANFDGLVGPTHNYAGLSPGNLASLAHAGRVSSPRAAALQGLAKMRRLASWGIPQHVLPPHERPNTAFLRRCGFTGTDTQVLERAMREAPSLLAAASSASAMWAANAATVSPAPDTADAKTHFTPANLAFNVHRCQEPWFTRRVLDRVFCDESRFAVHDPLPPTPVLFDEGAANHTRLCARHGEPGVELFVWGRTGATRDADGPGTLPARQTREACAAIARAHGLDPEHTVLARQHPAAIDAGVFHNDVISVGSENVLLLHERAYERTDEVVGTLRAKLAPTELFVFEVTEDEVSLAEAVKTYLFNAQLVRPHGAGGLTLLAPAECERSDAVRACVDRLVASDAPVERAEYIDVRESMDNGGGPACLRLRVVLSDDDRASLGGRTALDDALAGELEAWIVKHYRETLSPTDLGDPSLLTESRDALDELTRILGLPNLYDFQR